MSKIAFLGGGSFATALSNLLAKKGHCVYIWARDEKVVNDINENRRNSKYMKNLKLNSSIHASCNMKEVLYNADYVVFATASHVVRQICEKAKSYVDDKSIIINVAKGIEEGTLKLMSDILEEEFSNPVVVLSGPSHAEEVAEETPTTVVASSKNIEYAENVQELFMTSYFRVYTNDDLVGVEIGGAVKNIIALAAGITDGIGYGDNAKAALMTRGMSEIIRVGEKLGGKKETFFGLTGMGDLIVTCTSMHSRNRRAGILIGKGKTMDEAIKEVGMVVEGIKACKSFYFFKEDLGVSMPITDMLYKVLFENKDPKQGVYELMQRDKKKECY